MKKIASFVSILILSLLILQDFVIACTNFLITKGASKDGSVMISYTADSHTLYGELYHWPARDYPEGTMMDIYEWDTGKFLGRIPQALHTYNVVGNMNEHQLAIGETTFGGREELVDTTAILDYGSLMFIALQRTKTAREAILLIADLVEKYGYCSEGESFSIADKNEVWIMEIIGKGPGNKGAVWVALRIPDGYICAHANQARITTFPLNDPENCLYAKDVISFARKKGYFNGKDEEFSFSDVYNPVDFSGARFCESRVWSIFNRVNKNMGKYLDYVMGKNLKNRMPLWIKPDKKISLYEAMELMRDHFEGTPMDLSKDVGAGPYNCPYRWRPLTWKIDKNDKNTYFNERAISTQQTGFSFVAQSRSWLPDPIGGIIWFGVDDTYSSVYTPMYSSITRVPNNFAVGNGSMMEFSDSAAFWIFNQVSNFAYTRYRDIIPEIRAVQKELEMQYITNTSLIDERALELYEQNPELAIEYLTEYSCAKGAQTFTTWKALYKHLFTKFMDGNIKTVVPGQRNPKVSQPGYGSEWYKLIVKETGDKFKVIGEPGH
ncbi:MAG: C69 family dipeptidase [Ignavibacteria bacterium]|nr:C69 family dipeptidase [Ignavibacteria bacterium]